VEVLSPLEGQGFLSETLVWSSQGPWTFVERVSYRGVQGSETLRYSRLNPGQLSREYASLVQQLNEAAGLRLFGGSVPDDLEPICNPGSGPSAFPTRVTLTIRDEARGEAIRWVRCARGTLFTMAPGESGPDAPASRVITAGQLTRFFTLGENALPTYPGTVPYATLEQGESSPARPTAPLVFVSETGAPPQAFRDFWTMHAGAGAALPTIDWASEIVLLVAVGEREEAGDVVEIRRIVPIGGSTRVEIVERVPGDFCSPAAKRIHPFHLVVAPAVPLPIEFAVPQLERVPCGV
jgi:hypothetical protein